MSEKITFREFQENDRTSLENIIRGTWNYDRLCTPKTAQKLASVYLNSCLANQTYTQVALIDNKPVGIIMCKNKKSHRCPFKIRIRWMVSVISLYTSKEGRRVSKIFECVENIDKELLKQCSTDYNGELSFFAISEKCRGKGIGKSLFEKAVLYMQSQNIFNFYLFTDTSCNYGFYEHQGMERQGERRHMFEIKGHREKMTFYIYDFQC